MNTIKKLRICNRFLAFSLLLILISGLQLELTSGKYGWSVWLHIILGSAFTLLSIYHIFLHYRKSNWFARFTGNRNTVTRILWWLFLLSSISGVAGSIKWIECYNHSILGAVHGKIGFLMVIAAIIHAARHIRRRAANSL